MSEYVSERRAINTLCAYWDQLRENRSFPTKDEIDPEEIMEIWPNCFMLRVHDSDGDKKYECIYAGSEAIKLYDSDLRHYSEAEHMVIFFPQIVENLFDYLESVVENRRPLIEETENTTVKGNDVKIRQCLLPLGSENNIDHIIGVVGGRIY